MDKIYHIQCGFMLSFAVLNVRATLFSEVAHTPKHTTVPSTIPTTVVEINLSANLIASLPNAVFSSYSSLKVLKLSKNVITGIEPNAFDNAALEVLDLSENQLTAIPSSAFSYIGSSLEILNLTGNQITTIPAASLAQLTTLWELFLGANKLSWAVGDMDGLGSVSSTLKVLDLHNNNASSVLDNAALPYQFSALRELFVYNCDLYRIPPMPPIVTNLIVYDLRGNKLLNNDVVNSPLDSMEIEQLDLYHNLVSNYPLFSLKLRNSLKAFRFGKNIFSSQISPHLFEGMTNVTMFGLAFNFLKTFPEFPHMPSMEVLDLTDNSIKFVHAAPFANLTALIELRLADNFIEAFEDISSYINPGLKLFTTGNFWVCNCSSFRFVLKASSVYNLYPMNVTLNPSPCYSPNSLISRSYTSLTLSDIGCPPETTIIANAASTQQETTIIQPTTIIPTTVEILISSTTEAVTIIDSTTIPIPVATLECNRFPTWFDLRTNTSTHALGEVISYWCADGYEFSDQSSMKSSQCSNVTGEWDPSFDTCSQKADPEASAQFLQPVEAKNAEVVGSVAWVFVVVELTVILMMDSLHFVKIIKMCKKKMAQTKVQPFQS